MGLFQKIRDAIAFVAAIAHVLGWLGWLPAVVGVLLSIGASIWAATIGTSLPIVIMAAYCTIIATLYLALAPLIYRLLSQQLSFKGEVADLRAWRLVAEPTVLEAAYLFSEIEPQNPGVMHPTSVNGWTRALCEKITRNELDFVVQGVGAFGEPVQRMQPNINTKITRSELRKFAKANKLSPRFLED